MTNASSANSFYEFATKSLDGKPLNMADYKGKVVLVVNVASKCGFTGQYEGLQKLYAEFRDQGLEILGFPCNQFGFQEPGSAEEIQTFCSVNYNVTFKMCQKVEVNGGSTDPLWAFLKSQQKGVLGTEAIKWNFTKFLVGRDGTVIQRYAPNDKPEDLRNDIISALAQA